MTDHVNRRTFVQAAGASVGLGMAGASGCVAGHHVEGGTICSSPPDGTIRNLVDATPFVDTHEHLWPESKRVQDKTDPDANPVPDFGMLLSHYADSDLQVAGLPPQDYKKLISPGLEPHDKWKIVAPYYERCRHTGYLRCVRESVRALYDEDDIRGDNCQAISDKLREQVQPGYYRRILRDVANIEYAHVNCLNGPVFRDNEEQPDLLAQDLWTIGLGTGLRMDTLRHEAGGDVASLAECHATIDTCFEKYGPRAIAVKDQGAYWRTLKFDNVSAEDAAPLFKRFAEDEKSLAKEELKALQDHLFRYCVAKATECGLPVKLHTGYFAGHGSMNLRRVRDNLSDLCSLFRDFPDTRFVLMHISYPYQEELIALCKHYPQVYADMCWAWIINPLAAARFLKEFIMAAPASKVFTFGGDYLPVELVPGHARIARCGIAQAIEELVQEGWLSESHVPALVNRIMRGNAHETFDLDRTLRAW
ncbi:MAG: amidohydrolase family protein [bacterium]|nr:amidohydrolase family protein [bacterium]